MTTESIHSNLTPLGHDVMVGTRDVFPVQIEPLTANKLRLELFQYSQLITKFR